MKQLILKAGSLLVLTLASFQCTSAYVYYVANRVTDCQKSGNLPIKVRLNFADGTYRSEVVPCYRYGLGPYPITGPITVGTRAPAVSLSAARCKTGSCDEADQNVKPPAEGGPWFLAFPPAELRPTQIVEYLYIYPDEVTYEQK